MRWSTPPGGLLFENQALNGRCFGGGEGGTGLQVDSECGDVLGDIIYKQGGVRGSGARSLWLV